jgi:hypothetical protein
MAFLCVSQQPATGIASNSIRPPPTHCQDQDAARARRGGIAGIYSGGACCLRPAAGGLWCPLAEGSSAHTWGGFASLLLPSVGMAGEGRNCRPCLGDEW